MKAVKLTLSLPALLLAASLLLSGCMTDPESTAVQTSASQPASADTPADTTEIPADTTEVPADTTEAEASPSKPLGDRTLETLIDEIYTGISGVEFPTVVSREISLADADKDMFRYMFGIDPPEGAVAAAASEPMIGSIPYTMALLQMAEGSDLADVAESIKSGVDPHKWICVWADTVETAYHGDVILLIMDKDAARAQAVLDAFDKAMR